jgi:hypothetical protein
MPNKSLRRKLPEYLEQEILCIRSSKFADVSSIAQVTAEDTRFEVKAIQFGPSLAEKSVPTVVFIGGVHGLERIGTQVVLSAMRTFVEVLSWDSSTQEMLKKIRVIFIPLLNPGGMYLNWRANPNGVDLMRNAPVEADTIPKYFSMLAGHRKSSKWPWYRGVEGAPMEQESQSLVDLMTNVQANSSFVLSLDVHSGYGRLDRLWFPYAFSRQPFANLAETFELKSLLDRTLPHHVYQMEPQSSQYTTHGDLWDYMYLMVGKQLGVNPIKFLPLCLEMGSWAWIRKNPKQLLSALGVFNPMLPHRRSRIQRRHLLLFDFLIKACLNFESWASLDANKHQTNTQSAQTLWYPKTT